MRYFSVAQANTHVVTLERTFTLVMQLRGRLKDLYRRLDEAGFPPQNKPSGDIPDDVARQRALFFGMAETLREQVQEIQATGCIIKDIETGLVDWPAWHEGREIWLCWKYGETEVGYWHELSGGFAGRRPVSELNAE